MVDISVIKPTRYDKIKILNEKASNGIKLIIDCGFEDLMKVQEIASLSKQIARCYSANKNSENPFNLIIYDIGPKLEKLMIQNNHEKWKGVKSYCSKDLINFDHFVEKLNTKLIDTNEVINDKVILQNIPDIEECKKNIIYLTGDSPNEIKSLEKDKVYIVGGIVDRNRHKLLTLKKAEDLGISHAKLPIDNYIHLATSQILATNHVVEILVYFNSVKEDWKEAFCSIIPKRKQD